MSAQILVLVQPPMKELVFQPIMVVELAKPERTFATNKPYYDLEVETP